MNIDQEAGFESIDVFEQALAQRGLRYWEYDIKTKRLYRSALVRDEVGYSAYKDNVPESYVEEGIIHPDYAQAYLDFYHNLQKGIDARLVFQSRFYDGSWGWLDISYKVLFDANGSPAKAIGIGGNITKQKEAEKKAAILKRKVDAFTLATRYLFHMFVSGNLTKNTYQLIVNKGILNSDVPGEGVYDTLISSAVNAVIYEDDREMFQDKFARENLLRAYHEGKRVVNATYRHIIDDGSCHWFRNVVIFAKNEIDDDILEFSFTENIDDIKEKEHILQEREKMLEEAVERANRANAAKSEFLSRMSHDMRTPMNGILGMTDLCEEETDLLVLQENIEKIKSSGKYLLGLINETLDYQKIESGLLTLVPKVIPAKELLDSVNGIIEPMAAEKGVNYKVIIDNVAILKYVKVDPIRIRQIFVNILSNAVKFTKPGGTVEFAQTLIHRDSEFSRIKYTITDNGSGMSEEFMKNKIFKPFSQDSNTSGPGNGGTGLGLSIVKRLVELMNGEIFVESELGVGSRFTVILDYVRIDEVAVEEKVSDKNQRVVQAVHVLENKHILLVEDHPLNAQIAQRLLEKAGCIVTWAKNGREGVERFEESKMYDYDCILMDLRMPLLGGLDATKEIRALEREDAKKIPIIAVTANAYLNDIEECMDAGMNAHIAKPFEPRLMYETIARYIG